MGAKQFIIYTRYLILAEEKVCSKNADPYVVLYEHHGADGCFDTAVQLIVCPLFCVCAFSFYLALLERPISEQSEVTLVHPYLAPLDTRFDFFACEVRQYHGSYDCEYSLDYAISRSRFLRGETTPRSFTDQN